MITNTQLADRRMMIESQKLKKKKDEITGFEDSVNPNHYTDASKYAQEYYGQRREDTIRWDDVGDHNDWS